MTAIYVLYGSLRYNSTENMRSSKSADVDHITTQLSEVRDKRLCSEFNKLVYTMCLEIGRLSQQKKDYIYSWTYL
jgi:hypothetical protein